MKNEPDKIDDPYGYALRALAVGFTPQQVRATLMRSGLNEKEAGDLVEAASEARIKQIKWDGMKIMAAGVGVLILGAAITAIGYAATPPGGTYIVPISLLAVGGVCAIVGFIRAFTGRDTG